MPAGRRNLQRPFGLNLTLHIGKVLAETAAFDIEQLQRIHPRRRNIPHSRQKLHHLLQGFDPYYIYSVHYGRLARIGHRQHDSLQAILARTNRQRQSSLDGPQRTVERQFAKNHVAFQPVALELSRCRKDRNRNRQIEQRSLLSQVGRSQIDHDLSAAHTVSAIDEGGPDALLTLAHGIVGQPHQIHPDTQSDIGLHGNRHGVDADHRSGEGPHKHI